MAEESHAAVPVISNWSGRHVHMPACFKDFLPGSSTHLAHMPLSAHQQWAINRAEPLHSPIPSSSPDESSSRSHSPRPSLVPFTTEPDKFGLYRVYANEPTYTPQNTLESACDAPGFFEHPTIDIALRQAILGVPGALDLSPNDIFAPFTNPTSGILMVLCEAYSFVGRAKLDCLEGGTHEETLRPQVNPMIKCRRAIRTKVLSRLLKDSRVR